MSKVLPESWNLESVGDICVEIIDCVNKTAPTVEGPTPYKMIRTTNVRHGRVSTHDVKYADEKTYLKWTRRSTLRRNDIILTREAPLGEIGLVRSDEMLFLGQRTMLYRADGVRANQQFLYYAMQGSIVQNQIRSWGSGATVEHLRVPDASKFVVPLPTIQEQRKIAAVLTAYDDLIENNRQRIALLEKMAEEIYREWFVRLRFPGHEHTPIHKGVPKGWQRRSIDDLSLMVKRGISPRYDEKSEHIVLNQKCIRDHRVSFERARPHVTSMSKDKLLRRHDVLINSTGVGTLGRAAIYNLETTKVTVDSHITICRPNTDRIDATFYGFTVRSFENVFENLAAGATGQTELSAKLVKLIGMFDPPNTLQRRFSEIVRPMLDSQSMLLAQSESLTQTRDLLLNRLISGKLRVDDLDIRFPPSMAEDPS